MDYSTGKFKPAVPTIPTSEMNNFGKGQQPKGSKPFENIKVLDYKTNTVGFAPILLEPEAPSKAADKAPAPFPVYKDVAGELGLMQVLRSDQPAYTDTHTDRTYGPYFEWPRDKNGDIIVPNKKKTTAIYPNYGDVPLGASKRAGHSGY